VTYYLKRRQVVGGSLGAVLAFFKDPANPEAITPPWLQFRVLRTSDAHVREGSRILYTLKLHGVRFRWESRIAEYVENEHFADEQIVGPYAQWYHRHVFHAVHDGVEIEDVVEYRMRFGVLGRLAHRLVVSRQLEAIFDYRASAMAARFPLVPPAVRARPSPPMVSR
jgi:ligand-binding SRPBCC domain-containing protein